MAAPDEADKWAARVEGKGEKKRQKNTHTRNRERESKKKREREKERRYNGKVNPIIHSTVKQL